MPLYRVAPTGQLPHTIDLIQRQSAPRFANEVERDQQYPDPEIGALAVINTTLQVFNGSGWIPVGGGQPTLINNLQDVDARFPPDGAVLTWSSAAQAWGWSVPAAPFPEAWCDYFDRADGPLGADWVTPPEDQVASYYDVLDLSIVSGAVEAPDDGGTATPNRLTGYARRLDAADGDQFVELVVANLEAGAFNCGWIEMLCHMNGADAACRYAYFDLYENLGWGVWDRDAAGDDASGNLANPVTGVTRATSMTLRFESRLDGAWRLLVNDTEIDAATSTGGPPAGSYVGFALGWFDDPTAPGGGLTSPRIESVCGGGLV